MPRTEINAHSDLQVNVASPPGWTFAPGDTVIGTVVRRSSIVAPEATVRIALIGRVKTKVVVRNGNSSAVFRERKQLFSPTMTTQILFQGPLHIPPKQEHDSKNEMLSWPFSITIPTQSREEVTFQPTVSSGHHSNGDRTLPGTFYSGGISFYRSSEGFVEYYLEAQLRRECSYKVLVSTYPITLGRFPGTDLLGYNIQEHTVNKIVCSQRLLPGMENADLTLKQKAQKFFGSSKLPNLHYKVKITWPGCVQLDNPNPFPFILDVIPQQRKTSSGIQGVEHEIQLTCIKMCIKSKTELTAPTISAKRTVRRDNNSCSDLQIREALKDLKSPIIFSSEKENKPVDFGNMLQLVLHSNGLTTGKRHLSKIPVIHPSFSTTGITHSHWWDIEVVLSVVGEIHKILISSILEILPPREVDF